MSTQSEQDNEYQFTNDWFQVTERNNWDDHFSSYRPQKILESNSFEGASACYIIDTHSPHYDLKLYCIDTWKGSIEHQAENNPDAPDMVRF